MSLTLIMKEDSLSEEDFTIGVEWRWVVVVAHMTGRRKR